MEGSGAVELAEPTELSQGSQSLAQLNTTTDCYEAFLLNLLRVYTQNKIESLSSSDSGGGGTDTSTTDSQSDSHSATEGGSGVFTIDSISPEAIAALSHGQVQTLVTSNSANYDVIHQILAFKQRTEGGGGGDETGEKGEVEKDAATSPLKQLQALQLTPDQLKQIQLQMAELIRTKQIVLPAELSMEQQQQLLQSLILKQIHSQNQHLLAPSTTSTQHSTSTTVTTAVESTAVQPHTLSASPSTATISSPGNPSRVTVGSTLAAMLRGNTQDTNNASTAGGRAVKVEIQPHSNAQGGHETSRTITLQLGSTTVVGHGKGYIGVPCFFSLSLSLCVCVSPRLMVAHRPLLLLLPVPTVPPVSLLAVEDGRKKIPRTRKNQKSQSSVLTISFRSFSVFFFVSQTIISLWCVLLRCLSICPTS